MTEQSPWHAAMEKYADVVSPIHAFEQYALVDGDDVVDVGGPSPFPEEDGREWLPVLSIDTEPFDLKKHYRTGPHFERFCDVVLRIYTVVEKAEHDARAV